MDNLDVRVATEAAAQAVEIMASERLGLSAPFAPVPFRLPVSALQFVWDTGAVSGLSLLRFLERERAVDFSAEDWPRLKPDMRAYIEALAVFADALGRLLNPPAAAAGPRVLTPEQRPLRADEMIYGLAGDGNRKMDGGHGNPQSTAQVPVTRGAPGAAPLPVAAAPAFENAHARAPTQAEFMAMDPVERRGWAAHFGLPAGNEIPAIVTLAPAPTRPPQQVRVHAPAFGEDGVGAVAVTFNQHSAPAGQQARPFVEASPAAAPFVAPPGEPRKVGLSKPGAKKPAGARARK